MTNEQLADELILRLNSLLDDQGVRDLLSKLIEIRVSAPMLEKHITIQVNDGGVGFLGILNGIVGTIKEGPREGWGYIAAYIDDNGIIENFART